MIDEKKQIFKHQFLKIAFALWIAITTNNVMFMTN